MARPLTRTGFAPFGEVIETADVMPRLINQGTTERFHDLANVDTGMDGGVPLISIFRGQPFSLPVKLTVIERHPSGSQAFIGLDRRPFLVVVALPGAPPRPDQLSAFITNGRQGVNYARGVWHHPLLSLGQVSEFVVIDRGGPGVNLDEFALDDDVVVVADRVN